MVLGLLKPKVLRIFFRPHTSFATSPVLGEAIIETVIKDLQHIFTNKSINYNEHIYKINQAIKQSILMNTSLKLIKQAI